MKTRCSISPIRTVEWYQAKLANLLKMGVGAIKVDFGEAAPDNGFTLMAAPAFTSTTSIRCDTTKRSRTSPAGERRKYYLGSKHLGWQPALSDSLGWRRGKHRPGHGGGIARRIVLRAFGILLLEPRRRRFCGRSVGRSFRRWLAFGMLTSHSRCHGTAPKEPWNYSEAIHERLPRASTK